jgi:hypothetical protein
MYDFLFFQGQLSTTPKFFSLFFTFFFLWRTNRIRVSLAGSEKAKQKGRIGTLGIDRTLLWKSGTSGA